MPSILSKIRNSPRYTRFQSLSPERHIYRRNKYSNIAACGRCSRLSFVQSSEQLNQRNSNQQQLSFIKRIKMEYFVKDSDSIERIAASHDCTVGELMKMNKLGSRFVFLGQKLLVPSPLDDVVEDVSHSISHREATSIHRGPGIAVKVQDAVKPSKNILPVAEDETDKLISVEADAECMKRFIKLKVKQIPEGDEEVCGTLLVTPNALMFDPDIDHPLVVKNGQELYMMTASMDEVISIAMYRDGAETSIAQKSKLGKNRSLSMDKNQKDNLPSANFEKGIVRSFENLHVIEQNEGVGGKDSGDKGVIASKLEASNSMRESRLGAEDATESDFSQTSIGNGSTHSISKNETDNCLNELDEKELPNQTRSVRNAVRSSCISSGVEDSVFSRSQDTVSSLGRTISKRANSLRGTVASSAGRMTKSAFMGTKNVAQEVVSHGISAAGTLQAGIQNSAKIAASQARVAADAVATMPQGFADISSSLFLSSNQFNDSVSATYAQKEDSPLPSQRRQKIAHLKFLKQRTDEIRQKSKINTQLLRSRHNSSAFEGSLSHSERERLAFTDSSCELSEVERSACIYYMFVRLKRKNSKGKEKLPPTFESELHIAASNYAKNSFHGLRREFCFAISRCHVDSIFNFLLQWNPEKQAPGCSNINFSDKDLKEEDVQLDANEYLVLESGLDNEDVSGEKANLPASKNDCLMLQEWQFVTVGELCRRMSLDKTESVDLPLPDGSLTSKILNKTMIKQMVDILPARASGYPWKKIYSSEAHGFSLATFYRKMQSWKDEMSPILLLIRDCKMNIFGAIVSTAPHLQDHFFGTGDSCLLFRYSTDAEYGEEELFDYRWSGENQFFVKASKDSLSVGASEGHYGLWLDADLNYGRSQRCDTFRNDPLAGDDEDFTVQFVEAFGFRMG